MPEKGISEIKLAPELSNKEFADRLDELANQLSDTSPEYLSKLGPQLSESFKQASLRIRKMAGLPATQGHEEMQGESASSKDIIEKTIDAATYVRLNSFQEYVFMARRNANGDLSFDNGYKFQGKDDNAHRVIESIKIQIARKEEDTRMVNLPDEFGSLYVIHSPHEKSYAILGGGRIGADELGRRNNVAFQITIPDKTVAVDFLKTLESEPNKTLDQFMHKVFTDDKGKTALPTRKIRTKHREITNPFIHPIKTLKIVEI